MVGDGPEEQHLRAEVQARGLKEEVIFLGFRDDIPNVLKEVDILVLPSTTEAFPRVVIEGMAMGLPVIGTSVGGIPEAIVHGKTGLVVPPRDPGALHEALRILITSPDLRTRFGIEGRKRVETLFDNELNVHKVEDIYTTLLHPSGENVIESPAAQPTL